MNDIEIREIKARQILAGFEKYFRKLSLRLIECISLMNIMRRLHKNWFWHVQMTDFTLRRLVWCELQNAERARHAVTRTRDAARVDERNDARQELRAVRVPVDGDVAFLARCLAQEQVRVVLHAERVAMREQDAMPREADDLRVGYTTARPVAIARDLVHAPLCQHGEVLRVRCHVARVQPALHALHLRPCQHGVNSVRIAVAVAHNTDFHAKYSSIAGMNARRAAPRWLMACFSASVRSAMLCVPR